MCAHPAVAPWTPTTPASTPPRSSSRPVVALRVRTVPGSTTPAAAYGGAACGAGGCPELLLSAPPEKWPRWLAGLVVRVRPDDFRVRPVDLEGSLDLLTIAVMPR